VQKFVLYLQRRLQLHLPRPYLPPLLRLHQLSLLLAHLRPLYQLQCVLHLQPGKPSHKWLHLQLEQLEQVKRIHHHRRQSQMKLLQQL
jgi:hypothetical protein